MTEREKLPPRRACVTRAFLHNGQRYWLTASYFPGTRRPAEVFLSAGKVGSESESIARDGAILASLALQHGAPIETILHAVTRSGSGEAASILGATVDRLATASVRVAEDRA